MQVAASVNPKSIALPLQVIFDAENGRRLFAIRLLCFTLAFVWSATRRRTRIEP